MVCLCGWTFNKQAADDEAQACRGSILPLVFILNDCSATDLIQLLNKETIWVGN